LPAGSPGAVCAHAPAAPNPSNPVKTSGNTAFISHLRCKLAAINAEDLCFVPGAICRSAFAAINEKQIETPYSELTNEEKESDREQVRKYLPLIVDALSKKRE
jgi:hypothetical protein